MFVKILSKISWPVIDLSSACSSINRLHKYLLVQRVAADTLLDIFIYKVYARKYLRPTKGIGLVNCIWIYDINWRDVQRKHVANEVDRTKFRGTTTKRPLQKQTLIAQSETCNTTRPHQAISKNIWVCLIYIFI